MQGEIVFVSAAIRVLKEQYFCDQCYYKNHCLIPDANTGKTELRAKFDECDKGQIGYFITAPMRK